MRKLAETPLLALLCLPTSGPGSVPAVFVNLTVYCWVESHGSNALAVGDRVATGMKLALDKADTDMPYPHTVVVFDKEPVAERQEGAHAHA